MKRRLSLKMSVRVALLATVATIASLTVPVASHAYTHSWSCTRGSANTCTDATGQQYNSWMQIIASVASGASEVCAKGRTAAGNVRAGAGNGCTTGSNVTYRVTCLYPETPQTEAYVYWGGSGGPKSISGSADTPASITVC